MYLGAQRGRASCAGAAAGAAGRDAQRLCASIVDGTRAADVTGTCTAWLQSAQISEKQQMRIKKATQSRSPKLVDLPSPRTNFAPKVCSFDRAYLGLY